MRIACTLHAHPRMLLDTTLDANDRWMTIKMMYGAQSDEFDYHKVSLIDFILLLLCIVNSKNLVNKQLTARIMAGTHI